MYRPNTDSYQPRLFSMESQLIPSKQKKYRALPEYTFFELVFLQIDEKPFSVLYSSNPASRPNAPINSMVAALIHQSEERLELRRAF